MTRVIERKDWRWESSIGLWYGYHKDESVEQVARPVMSTPWWTIGSDLSVSGTFVRIYPDAMAAIKVVEEEYAERLMTVDLKGTVCTEDHGGPHNSATFYGHFGRNDVCVRVGDSDVWVKNVREAR